MESLFRQADIEVSRKRAADPCGSDLAWPLRSCGMSRRGGLSWTTICLLRVTPALFRALIPFLRMCLGVHVKFIDERAG